MSALGQKRTCAVQDVMSAIPPIATKKADLRSNPCLLYPQKRTCAVQRITSAVGHKRTFMPLFDQIVGAGNERRRHGQAHRGGGFA